MTFPQCFHTRLLRYRYQALEMDMLCVRTKNLSALLRTAVCAVSLVTLTSACSGGDGDDPASSLTQSEQACVDQGWHRALVRVGTTDRKVMWKAPAGQWASGAVLIFHGGGGKADDFCTGGTLVQPQVAFSNLALQNGFAVFALDATDNAVTDELNRPCGKRFDFAVTPRQNLDLPYVQQVLGSLVPANRPAGSNTKVFFTGLSTGGYMSTRAATHFDGLVTAFAPVSAGDPYGTDPICDPALSPRQSAVGILVDRETRQEIVRDNACVAADYPNESPWVSQNPAVKPAFKQFHHRQDGIVDYSCAQKANLTIRAAGYTDAGAYVLDTGGAKDVFNHLWLHSYNQPLIDFFRSR